MDSRKVMLHLVKAARDAWHLDTVLTGMGYRATPYDRIHGDITDAIYAMLDEQTDTFDNSVTCTLLSDPLSSDEATAEDLSAVFDHNLAQGSATNSFQVSSIPAATLELLQEVADRRGMDLSQLIRVILCEWASREAILESILR